MHIADEVNRELARVAALRRTVLCREEDRPLVLEAVAGLPYGCLLTVEVSPFVAEGKLIVLPSQEEQDRMLADLYVPFTGTP